MTWKIKIDIFFNYITADDMAKSKQSKSATCTPEELDDILTAPSGGLQMLPSNAYDEVYPRIYVGEEYVISIFGLYDIYLIHRKV